MNQGLLKQRTFGAILWMIVATGWASLASFVVFAVLARLLDPFTIGVFALAQIVVLVFATVVTTGFNHFIIQRRDLTEELADTVFWSTLGLAFVGAVVVGLAAGSYASIMNVPEVAAPLRSLALLLPLEALATVHLARTLRDFGHKVIAIRTFTSTLIAGGLAVAAAAAGMGIWSLILQVWMTSLLNAVFAWYAFPWVPRARFSVSAFILIIPYSGAVMVSSLLLMLLTRIPEIVLGLFWGPNSVGLYRVGWRLIDMIAGSVLHPIGNVALSTLSAVSNDRARREAAYFRLLNAGAVATLPLLAGCGVLAHEVIPVVLGPKWSESATIVQILSLMAIPQVLNFLVIPTLSAMASIRSLPGVAAVCVAATLGLTLLAAPYGLAPVCAAYVLRGYATIPYQQFVLHKSSGVSFLQCEKAIRPALIACCLMVFALELFKDTAQALFGKHVLYISIMTGYGAAVYCASIVAIDGKTVRSYIRMLVNK